MAAKPEPGHRRIGPVPVPLEPEATDEADEADNAAAPADKVDSDLGVI